MALDNPFYSFGSDYLAAKSHVLYNKTYILLGLKLDRNTESIEPNFKIKLGSRTLSPDLYLPNGCAKLNLPEKTAIELKLALQPDTLYDIDKLAKACIDAKTFNKVILLYSEVDGVEESVFDEVKNSGYVQVSEIDAFFGLKSNAKQEDNPTWNEIQMARKRNLFRDLCDYPISLFLGAGVSMSAGMPSWDDLLKSLLVDLSSSKNGLEIESSDFKDICRVCNQSAIVLGRYMMYGQKSSELGARIRRVIYSQGNTTSSLIESICNLTQAAITDSIITYNYDDLVERALESRSFAVRRLYGRNRRYLDELPVYHVHGLVPYDGKIPTCPVLSEQDYHKRYQEAYHWSNVEQISALSSNTCIFIGLSMTDPNLRRLLDIAQSSISNEQRHYAFLKRDSLNSESSERKNFSNIMILDNMLQSLGINAIWYENHNELPAIIEDLVNELTKLGSEQN